MHRRELMIVRIAVVAMFACLSWRSLTAQDAGQWLILHAEYGNDQNHVDVTWRLKELARTDRPFRVTHDSMATDPAHGRSKMLRVYARGPNGDERTFDFPDGSTFDGAQFRAWRRGEWGDEHWAGGWEGREHHDEGMFVIINAQYGNDENHVDVTNQLREMAMRDEAVRVDYRAFGVDPAEGRSKSLRVYARGPNGRERMFEYRDGTVVDGRFFRGWHRGEWGGERDHWSGRWEGEEREEREHPQ